MFERLRRLGKERFQTIVNQLARGTPAAVVARIIQADWGLAHEVGEETLSRQLNRLHAAILDGAFGGELSIQAKDVARVRLTALKDSTFDCLARFEETAEIQRHRVIRLREREVESGRHIVGLNVAMRDYRKTLIAIQKIRFDLGLDEYRFGLPPRQPHTSQSMDHFERTAPTSAGGRADGGGNHGLARNP